MCALHETSSPKFPPESEDTDMKDNLMDRVANIEARSATREDGIIHERSRAGYLV
jgi:hypothetical protein